MATTTPLPTSATVSPSSSRTLTAYRLGTVDPPDIVRGTPERAWISGTEDGFAKRCLPLLIANQLGWVVLNTARFTATWRGGHPPSEVVLEYDEPAPEPPAVSHFGHGILTWTLPYLFRTSPGYNLLARGPANLPKDGASALEGVVETDWSTAPFTMNWKLTRPFLAVTFDVGEPICQIVPVRRGELAEFTCAVVPIRAAPELHRSYTAWQASRFRFNEDLQFHVPEAAVDRWQRDYFRGSTVDGVAAPTHETRLHLRSFSVSDVAPRDDSGGEQSPPPDIPYVDPSPGHNLGEGATHG